MRLPSYLARLIWFCVLPLIGLSAWLAYTQVEGIRAQSERRATDIAHNLARAIDHHLNARVSALHVLANSPLAASPDTWPQFYQEAQAFQHHFGSHVILATSRDPLTMLFNTRLPYGANLMDLPRISGQSAAQKVIKTGQASISDLFFGPIAQEPLVSWAVPVKPDGRLSNLLIATYTSRHFQERIEEVALPAGWGLTLADSQGQAIASRGDDSLRSDKTGKIGFQANIPSKVSPWSVIVTIPATTLEAPVRAAAMTLMAGIALATLLGLGGGLWGTRRIGQAVASLANPIADAASPGPEIEEISVVRKRLQADSARIASFATAQDQAIEQERARVAREVHDQMGQVFTALKLIIQSIPRQAFPPNQEAALHTALEMGITSARRITAELRPALLDDLGLAAALEHYLKETVRNADITTHVAIRNGADLTRQQALGLFRIVQEALTNILRHANASKISLSAGNNNGRYQLQIEDDGIGFDPQKVRPGAMGLTIMQERCRMLGGTFEIAASPTGGSLLTLCIPIHTQEPPDAFLAD